jgi:hypothetical protein
VQLWSPIEDLRSKLRRIFDPLSNFFITRLPRSKRGGTELASSAKPMRSRGFKLVLLRSINPDFEVTDNNSGYPRYGILKQIERNGILA